MTRTTAGLFLFTIVALQSLSLTMAVAEEPTADFSIYVAAGGVIRASLENVILVDIWVIPTSNVTAYVDLAVSKIEPEASGRVGWVFNLDPLPLRGREVKSTLALSFHVGNSRGRYTIYVTGTTSNISRSSTFQVEIEGDANPPEKPVVTSPPGALEAWAIPLGAVTLAALGLIGWVVLRRKQQKSPIVPSRVSGKT